MILQWINRDKSREGLSGLIKHWLTASTPQPPNLPLKAQHASSSWRRIQQINTGRKSVNLQPPHNHFGISSVSELFATVPI